MTRKPLYQMTDAELVALYDDPATDSQTRHGIREIQAMRYNCDVRIGGGLRISRRTFDSLRFADDPTRAVDEYIAAASSKWSGPWAVVRENLLRKISTA